MRIILTFLVILLLLLQIQLWREYRAVQDLRALVADQIEQNEQLRARNEALAAEVDDLRAGRDAVEERARSELGLIRDGEAFYLIVSPDDVAEQDGDEFTVDPGVIEEDSGPDEPDPPIRPPGND